jgi:type I restriction-modification system DNA methylase subunit
MIWIAPSEKDTANDALEKRLWAAADQFCANSGLSAAQYSQPVLGLIFLRFAAQRARLEKTSASSRRGSRVDESVGYHANSKPNLAKPDRRSVGETELHYLWIQLFLLRIKGIDPLVAGGRAGSVMANSSFDADSLRGPQRLVGLNTILMRA